MAAKFEIKKSKNNQFYFSLVASNGQIILSGETYESQSGARGGAESVKRNAASDARFERRTSTGGAAYFVLKSENGEQIGRSETYSSEAAMEGGIESVKSNAPSAEIVDSTKD